MVNKNILLRKIQNLRKKEMTFKDRFLLGILFLGIALIIFLIFYLIWFTYSQRSIAHLLPSEKTVAFVEFEDFSMPSKLQSDNFGKQELESTIKNIFAIDDINDFRNWAGDRFGIALLKEGKKNIPLYFVQTNSRRGALKFFENLSLPEEELLKTGNLRLPIYSYPQGRAFSFAFIGPFVFISDDMGSLELIRNTFETKETSLSQNSDYQKSINNLPRQSWMSGYVNFQDLHSDNITVSNILEPLKFAIDHFAISIRKEQSGFHFNTFLNLNKNLLPMGKGYIDDTKFAYKLTDYISSENIALYIGGANLSEEWINTLETISNLNPAYGVILESIIRAQTSKVFGDSVDLRNDLYPLLEDEYALGIGLGDEGKLTLSLILSHDNLSFANTKLQKMMKGFRYLAAQFAPKLHIVTLPDGTESRELIADSSKLDEITEEYKGYEVDCMEVKGTNSGFCFAVTDELIIITNNQETAFNIIDKSFSSESALSEYQPFRQTIGNLSKVSDEVTFMDIQKMIPIFENNPYGMLAKPFLEKFDAVTWVKHYFDDGVSSEGFVLIK